MNAENRRKGFLLFNEGLWTKIMSLNNEAWAVAFVCRLMFLLPEVIE